MDTAKVNLGYTNITAPIGGTVLAIVSQEGQTVNASQSAPTIVVLGQLDRMTVRTEISESRHHKGYSRHAGLLFGIGRS